MAGAEWMLDFSFNKLVISYQLASLGLLCLTVTQGLSTPCPCAQCSQLHSKPTRNWLEKSKFPFFNYRYTGLKVSCPGGGKRSETEHHSTPKSHFFPWDSPSPDPTSQGSDMSRALV